jgi:hypothetical protein
MGENIMHEIICGQRIFVPEDFCLRTFCPKTFSPRTFCPRVFRWGDYRKVPMALYPKAPLPKNASTQKHSISMYRVLQPNYDPVLGPITQILSRSFRVRTRIRMSCVVILKKSAPNDVCFHNFGVFVIRNLTGLKEIIYLSFSNINKCAHFKCLRLL